MDKKVTGIVAYLTIIGWLIAFLAGDKEGAKFHLNQSLVLCVISLILSILGKIPFVGIIAGILNFVVGIFTIIGFIYAIQDKEKEVPLLGAIKILK